MQAKLASTAVVGRAVHLATVTIGVILVLSILMRAPESAAFNSACAGPVTRPARRNRCVPE